MARGRTERQERKKWGEFRTKLDLHSDLKERLKADDMVPYWANDVKHGERVQELAERGYEFVTAQGYEKIGEDNEKQEKGRKIKKIVGTAQDGSPIYAFLMAIKRKWYEEDQAKKEETNKMVDEAVMGYEHGIDPNNPSRDGTYRKNINYKT